MMIHIAIVELRIVDDINAALAFRGLQNKWTLLFYRQIQHPIAVMLWNFSIILKLRLLPYVSHLVVLDGVFKMTPDQYSAGGIAGMLRQIHYDLVFYPTTEYFPFNFDFCF